MLLGGSLVGPSKNGYGNENLILTLRQEECGSTAIHKSIPEEVHGRRVLKVLSRMLPSLRGDGRAKNGW
jgi:hypothetical protein